MTEKDLMRRLKDMETKAAIGTVPILDAYYLSQEYAAEAVRDFVEVVKRSFDEEYRKEGSAFDVMNATIVQRLDELFNPHKKD